MLQSKLFGKTNKKAPREAKAISHKLLYQGGFIRESVAGRYYFLPLGMKTRDKIVKVIEQEMDKSGALKIITPVLHPIELWKETKRTEAVGFELMTVKDRSKNEFALGGTAEEMIVDLVRKFNISYKDLPFNIYQFSQKFRDELRARGGLLRVREFLMKDAYSFHKDEKDFQKEYQKMREVYTEIFKKLGLETIVVEADNGYIGGDYCHEFIVESEAGESKFLISEDGKYAAHEDVAKFKKEEKKFQIKDVMFVDDKNQFVLAVIRGDFEVNEIKLKNLIKANSLRRATDDEIRKLGSEPGFISPIGINKKVIIVADDSLRIIKNGYGGANKKYRDFLNINIGRDYKPKFEGDIAMAKDGFLSEAGSKLKQGKGIEVGNIFQLGNFYSKKMKAAFTDKDGKEKFYYMGCYGIGIDRTMAAIVEIHNDKKGIVWPSSSAPYDIHLIKVESRKLKVESQAEKLYKSLQKEDIEVLYDDRNESPGIKFADADLIGIPLRIVISERTIAKNSVELKKRNEEKTELVKVNEIINKLKNNL